TSSPGLEEGLALRRWPAPALGPDRGRGNPDFPSPGRGYSGGMPSRWDSLPPMGPMIDGTVAAAQLQGVADGSGDVVLGFSDRFEERTPLGQLCGQSGGKGTARTVGVTGVKTGGAKLLEVLPVKKKSDGLFTLEVPPLDHDGARSHFHSPPGGFPALLLRIGC